MDHDHEEETIDDDQGTVRDVSLHIDRNLLDVVVVLEEQRYEHEHQERG